MKTKQWKRLLAGILCVTMVSVSTGPVVYAADESTTQSSFAKESYEQESSAKDSQMQSEPDSAKKQTADLTEQKEETAKRAGSFVLAASGKNENLILPVYVTYEAGDTIWTALQKSGYKFERSVDDSFVKKIEGKAGNYCVFCDDGSYDLDASPEDIQVVEFTEMTEYAKSRSALLFRMAEYEKMTNHVQKDPACAKAYDNARKTYRNAEEDVAASLLKELNNAIAAYEKYLSAAAVKITVNAMQDGKTQKNLTLKFTDAYDNTVTAKGTTISLRPGTYSYEISDGGYNSYENADGKELKITKSMTIQAELPSGKWFSDVKLLKSRTDADGKKQAYTYETDADGHSVTCKVDDRAGENEKVYLYAERGQDLPDRKNASAVLSWWKIKEDTQDSEPSAERETIAWESEKNDCTSGVKEGMTGGKLQLEARYTVKNSSGTSGVQVQKYQVTFERVPTADISLKDAKGRALNLGFEPDITEYETDTVSSKVSVETKTYGTDGYSVMVKNGDTVSEDGNCNLSKGTNSVTVTVAHTNGKSRTYHFKVNLVEKVPVTLKTPDGVKAVIVDAKDREIEPEEDGTYALIPGASYSYIASKDDTYFAKETFQVKAVADGTMTVTAAEPEEKDGLAGFAMYNAAMGSRREVFTPEQEFESGRHMYQYAVPDANSAIYVQANTQNDYQVKAVWTKQSDGTQAEQTRIAAVNTSKGATVLGHVIEACAYGNTVTIVTYKEISGVTYYQNYEMNIRRSLHLKSLKASNASGDLTFVNANGTAEAFDREIYEYQVNVAKGTKSVHLSGSFLNEENGNWYDGGYYAVIGDKMYSDLSDIEVPISENGEDEEIKIQVAHANLDTVQNTYTICVKKKEPVQVTFQVDPEDANIFIQNETDHTTVYTENGICELLPGTPYSYTITKNGYKAVRVTDFRVEEDIKVPVTLEEAPENTEIKDLNSQWPSFRDENNNVVLDEKTPVKAEDSVLYWANKDDFDGYCGHPILVDGYLYTYDSKNLLKMDTITGKLVKRGGALARPSSFAIQPPTYADGMIFVGLSQGTIQAFNAKTMESLWVYEDPLGGQPNCQITYKNGYIYTGFWNSETAEANYVCISAADEDPSQTNEKKVATWTHTGKGGYYWAGTYADESGKFLLQGTEDGESGYKSGYAHVFSMNPKNGKVIDDLTLPFTGDIRCNIVKDTEGDNPTGDYYFTSKSGYFYRISVNADGTFDKDSLRWIKLENSKGSDLTMSTSTPTVYNGRAYVGVSGSEQFGAYSGHGIAVLDLKTMSIAYVVPTQGYPQTSGVLTRAYEKETGKVYVYFFDNYTPGKLRVISDEPGQTEATDLEQETDKGNTYDVGTVLFTPSDAQAQYALCNPIVDEYGTLYFRNDSNHMMALGATISKLEVTKQPKKTSYKEGEKFDPSGMQVIATYTNGKTRDVTEYVSYSEESLTPDDTDLTITFPYVKYQNRDGQAGCDYTAPITSVSLDISKKEPEVEPEKEVIQEKNVTLAKTSYTYNGKVQKPTVKAKNAKGRIVATSNYTVSYASGRKNVGSYKVTVKFKGDYKGTVTKTFQIVPKGTKITTLKAGKKSFTAKWSRQKTQTTGYQFSYTTDKKFKKSVKTITISKNITVQKTVKKLKSKKLYYGKVRTYKTVKINGKTTKLYSGWSSYKKVKTK